MAKGWRKTHLDWDKVKELFNMQNSQEEIAAFYGISIKSLERYCREDLGHELGVFSAQKRLTGKVRARKNLFRLAESNHPGAVTASIYLHKVLCPTENPNKKQEPVVEKDSHLEEVRTFSEFCANAGYPIPYYKQKEMREFVFDVTEPRELIGARGVGKTDYTTIAGVAYDIYLNGTNTTNLIMTDSQKRNKALVGEIAHFLKANSVRLSKDTSEVLRIEGLVGKDHSVEAMTIGSSMRGRHPKRIIMDDPVTEKDTSAAKRSQAKKAYEEAYKLTSNICLIGQYVHPQDLYSELEDNLRVMKVPHGTIPELDADLEAMEAAGVSRRSIDMSYRLFIPKEGETIFSGLNKIPDMPPGQTVAFIDPSDGGDYTAISVLRSYMDGICVYGKVWKRAWYHCIDDIENVVKEKSVSRVCFETNATGSQPIEQLRQVLDGVGVVGKHSTSNKHSTIVATGSYAHMIHLSNESDSEYIRQVENYEMNADYDDAPDSLARCLEWIGLIKGGK